MKYWQAKLNNILIGSYIMTKWDLSQGCKDGSIFTNQYDIPHYEMKNKNHMTITIDVDIAFDFHL